jgi:hypothetical protein
VELRTHSLQATTTFLLQADVGIRKVQELLGHHHYHPELRQKKMHFDRSSTTDSAPSTRCAQHSRLDQLPARRLSDTDRTWKAVGVISSESVVLAWERTPLTIRNDS